MAPKTKPDAKKATSNVSFASSASAPLAPMAAETAHDIAVIGGNVAPTPPPPEPAPTMTPRLAPNQVREAVDAVITKAAETPAMPALLVPPTTSATFGSMSAPPSSSDTKKVPPVAPPPAASSTVQAPASSAIKPTNEQIVTVRSLLLRRIKKYQKVFPEEAKEHIPASYQGLDNDKLDAICKSIDTALGDTFGREAVNGLVIAFLTGVETMVLPWVPGGEQYQGVTIVADHVVHDPESKDSPLVRAMDRLAIKYTGTFDTSAELGLIISLWNVFQMTSKINIESGRYIPGRIDTSATNAASGQSRADDVSYDDL